MGALSAVELKALVRQLRQEVRRLRDDASGSTVTVKKGEGAPREQFPSSLPEKLALASDLESERDEEERGGGGGGKNLISGLVYTLTLGNVNIDQPKPSAAAPAAAPAVMAPPPQAAPKALPVRVSQAASAKPSTPGASAEAAAFPDTSDRAVGISYIGSQRIVTRNQDASTSSSGSVAPAEPVVVPISAPVKAIPPPTAADVPAVSAPVSAPKPAAATAPLSVPKPIPAPTSAPAPAPAAGRKAADGMSLTQLTGAMKTSLGLSPALSVTETVSNACAKLRIAPTGNVKNDAVSCYLALPPTNTAPATAAPAVVAASTAASIKTTTTAPPAAAPAGNDLVSRVRNFYQTHNPDKGDDEIAGILRFYVGRETELIRKLEKKYGATFA